LLAQAHQGWNTPAAAVAMPVVGSVAPVTTTEVVVPRTLAAVLPRPAVVAELGPAQATMMMEAAVVETLALVTAGRRRRRGW
jgi:hypothetical protein